MREKHGAKHFNFVPQSFILPHDLTELQEDSIRVPAKPYQERLVRVHGELALDACGANAPLHKGKVAVTPQVRLQVVRGTLLAPLRP